MESLRFSVEYQVILDEVLLLPFQFRVPLFFSLVWLLWLDVPILCWIKVMIVGFLVLLLNEEIFSFLCMMLALCLSYITYIMLMYIPSIPSLFRVFINNECWILLNVFPASTENNLIFIFHFINVFYHIDWFAVIKPSLHLWDKPHLIMVYDLFNTLLNLVC